MTPFFILLQFILIFSSKPLFSQDYAKIQELVEKLNKMINELDECGTDMDCINQKSKEMEKISTEIEEAQKTSPIGQDTKLYNLNVNVGQAN
jgi:hypothetical protein